MNIKPVAELKKNDEFVAYGTDKIYRVVEAFVYGVGTICHNIKTGEIKNLCCDAIIRE